MRSRHIAVFVWLAGLFMGGMAPSQAYAAEVPTALSSPLAGVNFADPPVSLPVGQNFQTALTTVGQELNRTCGAMEAYGWRLQQSEQARVNQIFQTTVDALGAEGYRVEAKTPAAISQDISVFTADRPDKHLVVMWSAGELGLVMLLCDGRVTDPSYEVNAVLDLATSAGTPSSSAAPVTPVPASGGFTVVGQWVGHYRCPQGKTGATMTIAREQNGNVAGTFRFYPMADSPRVASGKYTIEGQYDRVTQKALLNPGTWLERPPHYGNAMIIGEFFPETKTFSGIFQGVTGCTSFEAKYAGVEASPPARDEAQAEKKPAAEAARKAKPAKKKPVKKKTPVKKNAQPEATATPQGAAAEKKPEDKTEPKQAAPQGEEGQKASSPSPATEITTPVMETAPPASPAPSEGQPAETRPAPVAPPSEPAVVAPPEPEPVAAPEEKPQPPAASPGEPEINPPLPAQPAPAQVEPPQKSEGGEALPQPPVELPEPPPPP